MSTTPWSLLSVRPAATLEGIIIVSLCKARREVSIPASSAKSVMPENRVQDRRDRLTDLHCCHILYHFQVNNFETVTGLGKHVFESDHANCHISQNDVFQLA